MLLVKNRKVIVKSKITKGPIAQLARALAWHARGPGFKSPWVHHQEFHQDGGIFVYAEMACFKSKCAYVSHLVRFKVL